MKKLERKSIILIVFSFIVAFIVAMSLLWTPQKIYSCDVETFRPISTLGIEDVTMFNQCVWDADGSFYRDGVDPYITFQGLTESGRIIKLDFKEPLREDMSIELFVNVGRGFNEADKVRKECVAGDTQVCFVFSEISYSDIRMDINGDCKIESIQLGNEGVIENNATENEFWYVPAFVFSILSAGAVYVLEEKKSVTEKIVVWFKKYKSMMLKSVVALIVFGIIAAGVSFVYCNVIYDIHFMSVKGIYTFVMVMAFVFFLLCGIACIWNYRNTLLQDIEKVFVMMTLIIGFGMIVIAPFAHLSWDVDSHYSWALIDSYLGDVKYTQSDWLIRTGAPEAGITGSADENYVHMGILNSRYNEIIYATKDEISLPHMPSGIFIALGRLLGLPFVLIYMLGKVPNLLIYTGLCYLGMKQLKDGKLLLAVIALFPTNLLLATNYSYDFWITCFSIFAMAYYIGILQDKERVVDGKDAFIMSACFALSCIPKPVYFPLLLIPFLMPPKKIENKKKYYLICMLLFVALLAIFFIRSSATISGGGDTRGGSGVATTGQLAYIFGDIWNYAIILLRFLFTQYLTVANMENYISYYAYLGVAEGSMIFIILIIITLLFDKDSAYTRESKPNWLNRVYTILLYFGGAAIVATSMYVAYTPVGLDTVLGCQARYMTPWLYPVLSIWAMNGVKPLISKKVLTWAVVLGCYGMLFYNLATVFLPSVACLG